MPAYSRTEAQSRPARSDFTWLAFGGAVLAALLWTCRGAPFGVPVADDYLFLARVRFQHPLEWFDSMGAAWYWRPVSRQLYYSALAPALLRAPWIAAALHVVLLAALYVVLFRIARRIWDAPVAAAIASFPLLAEPTRLLLIWPSGAQHLIAMLGVAFAVHETLSGRRITAAIALLVALLSHELGALALPAVPLVAFARGARGRALAGWLAASAVPAALWLGGRAVAATHGMRLPPGGDLAHFAWGQVPEILMRSLIAQLNLESLGDPVRVAVRIAYLLIAALALLVFALDRAARRRLMNATPALAGALVWFVVGVVPFAGLLPDWNGWHAALPGLGLGFAALGALGSGRTWLAVAIAAVRLVALLALPGPRDVTGVPPATASLLSFERVTRLQRVVGSTHEALTSRFATLPTGAEVRYWSVPLLSEVGYSEARALRVWYGDSTLHWRKFGGEAGLEQRVDALIDYNLPSASPAVVIEPIAIARMRDASRAMRAGRLAEADSLLLAALEAQPRIALPFEGAVLRVRASIAAARGDTTAERELLSRIRTRLPEGPRPR